MGLTVSAQGVTQVQFSAGAVGGRGRLASANGKQGRDRLGYPEQSLGPGGGGSHCGLSSPPPATSPGGVGFFGSGGKIREKSI